MRWYPKPKPKLHSLRIIKRFAWFPVLVNKPNRQYIWLEFYKIKQEYVHNYLDGMCYWIAITNGTMEYWGSNENSN